MDRKTEAERGFVPGTNEEKVRKDGVMKWAPPEFMHNAAPLRAYGNT